MSRPLVQGVEKQRDRQQISAAAGRQPAGQAQVVEGGEAAAALRGAGPAGVQHGLGARLHGAQPAGPPRCSTQVSSRWAISASSAVQACRALVGAGPPGGPQRGQRVQPHVRKAGSRLARRAADAESTACDRARASRVDRVDERGRGSRPAAPRRRPPLRRRAASAAPALSRPSAHSAPRWVFTPPVAASMRALRRGRSRPRRPAARRPIPELRCRRGTFGEGRAQRLGGRVQHGQVHVGVRAGAALVDQAGFRGQVGLGPQCAAPPGRRSVWAVRSVAGRVMRWSYASPVPELCGRVVEAAGPGDQVLDAARGEQ